MTRASVKTKLDYGRLGKAVSRPGIDPRVWIAMARVDDDPDAISWDGRLGWLVDVTFIGGPLDQEGPVVCKVSPTFAGINEGRVEPVKRGAEVVVLVVGGNPNENPVIIGYGYNEGGCDAPDEVNGTTINEQYALNTHILVTPHAIDEQVGGQVRVITPGKHIVGGGTVDLAEEGATHPFVKGDDLAGAVASFTQALITWAGAVATAVADPALTAKTADFVIEAASFASDVANSLSDRIRGE